jgi:hypothetical protein
MLSGIEEYESDHSNNGNNEGSNGERTSVEEWILESKGNFSWSIGLCVGVEIVRRGTNHHDEVWGIV